MKKYKVQKGDSLSSIADQFGVRDGATLRSYHNIYCPLDDLLGHDVVVGKELLIPEQQQYLKNGNDEADVDSTNGYDDENGELLEEGFILVGRNSIKKKGDQKYEIIGSSGDSFYDMTSGDNPTTEQETQICNYFSKVRLKNIKKWKNKALETEFEWALSLMSKTKEDTVKLAKHFYDGEGKLFVFNNASNLSKVIKKSEEFETFKTSLLEGIKTEIKKGSLRHKKEDGTYEILRLENIKLPYYKISNSIFRKAEADASAILGGIQHAIVAYKLFKNGNKYIATISKIVFYDTFGAGWDDACNELKTIANGLVAMFVLQHYRNVGNPKKYQPFVIAVEINF